MSRLRIKSNPYKKNVSYEVLNENTGAFYEINYNNNPSSKLISENYKNIIFSQSVKKIVEAIWDTFYNKDDSIQIIFCGTDSEFELLTKTCADDKYKNQIMIEKGELKLKSEKEINEEILSIANKLNIQAKVDHDNIFNTINDTIEAFKKEYKNLQSKITSMNRELYEINSSNDSSISLLLDTIEQQKKSRNEYMQKHKPDIDKISNDYIKELVLDKNSLEKKYDSIRDEIEKQIKSDQSINNTEDAETKTNDKKSILNSIVQNTKKLAIKGIDIIKTEAQIISNTDKRFNDEIGKMLVTSIENLKNDLGNVLNSQLKDREVLLKNSIEETINNKYNENNYFSLSEIFAELKYSDSLVFNLEKPEDQRFTGMKVLHYLPGLPDFKLIINEWKIHINKYVVNNYPLCEKDVEKSFSIWEERMINLLKEKIVKIDPNLKDKAEKINKIYFEQSKLNERINLVNDEISKVNSLIDYN